jgi:hypothetical protein
VPSCKLLTSIAKSHKNSGVSALLQNTGAEPCIVTQPAQGILQNTATKRTTSSNTATGNRSRSSSRQRARETRRPTTKQPRSKIEFLRPTQPNRTQPRPYRLPRHRAHQTKPETQIYLRRRQQTKRNETKKRHRKLEGKTRAGGTGSRRGESSPAPIQAEGGTAPREKIKSRGNAKARRWRRWLPPFRRARRVVGDGARRERRMGPGCFFSFSSARRVLLCGAGACETVCFKEATGPGQYL